MSELTSLIEVYDSELEAIAEVCAQLATREQRMVHLAAFEREIIDRFADIGLKVRVNWYEALANEVPVNLPEVVILDRIERIDFDHDRQVAEVTRDILGLGHGGVIKTTHLRPEEPGSCQH